MKVRTKAIIIIISSICLMSIGCATVPTEQQFAQADYGEYPADYKEIVKNYLEDHSPFVGRSGGFAWSTKFPYYQSYKWLKEPYKGYFVLFGQSKFGYIVHVAITARCHTDRRFSFGYKKRVIMIKNGKVVGSQTDNPDFLRFIGSYGRSVYN